MNLLSRDQLSHVADLLTVGLALSSVVDLSVTVTLSVSLVGLAPLAVVALLVLIREDLV